MKKKNIKAVFIHQGFELYGSDRSFLSFCKKQKIFEIKNTDIAKELALPPVKIHCSVLAEDAIKAAVSNYTSRKKMVD